VTAKGAKGVFYGMTPWNHGTISLLKEWWESGLTATEISAKFFIMGKAITRNAVIGKANRMSYKQPPRDQSPKAPRQQPRKRIIVPPSHPRVQNYVRRKPKTKLPTEIATLILDPNNPGISIMELDGTKCRAIVRDGTLNTLATYCGVPVAHGKSFCAAHCALYYVAPYERVR
jgi:hypothetical protein